MKIININIVKQEQFLNIDFLGELLLFAVLISSLFWGSIEFKKISLSCIAIFYCGDIVYYIGIQ